MRCHSVRGEVTRHPGETEQAFYAGAAACLTAITKSVDFNTEEPLDAEVKQLQAIVRELDDWFEEWCKR